MIKQLLVIAILFSSVIVFGQDNEVLFSKSAQVDNTIELVNDSVIPSRRVSNVDVQRLLDKRIAQNEQSPFAMGYRVQIASDNQRSSLVQKRYKYKDLHPDDKVYVVFQTPYYKLRVGNYYGPWGMWQAKFKANELKKEYGSVFFVKDKIDLGELYAED